ncbi:AMP-binding enzyme [Thermocatellispora tengchongensis]|uniref:AMP-binding enzyme n=1 Tax=Thermocatellispora tengchongensis TaxID=1073253 RepID=UPI00362843A6
MPAQTGGGQGRRRVRDPGPGDGESLAAHVELVPGAKVTADDVRGHVQRSLARYKVPKVVVFEERLPREDTGKLFKRRLKEKYRPAEGNA